MFMTESNEELHRRLTELEDRVTRLEEHPVPPSGDATKQEEAFWALHDLRERVDDTGGVVFAGVVPLPSGETFEWQMGVTAQDMLTGDWSQEGESLEALGHPVRLRLLQQVLSGATATAELKDDPALGTTGQLYHHLRRLVAAGWLRSEERGHYRVPPVRVIPLLTILLAARR